MLSKIFSIELHGLEGHLVEIEVDKQFGPPKFFIVGLPDAAVLEARDRVRSAIRHSGFEFSRTRIVTNLAPADLKKVGPRYDLAIALGILAVTKQIESEDLKEKIILGELAFDGSLRPVTGILSSIEFARSLGFKTAIVPRANAEEAKLISGMEIVAVESLHEAVQYLKKNLSMLPTTPQTNHSSRSIGVDMSMIKGQAQAKRALEIAAAGGHNILMNGTPGAGKTLMAKALSGILPSMTKEEMLEVTKVYSVSGLLPKEQPLITNRPFRTIHHTASAVSIVGGGNNPAPGEISLAHRGVLFMDEIAEFPRQVLEVLRQPMEDRQVTVSRVRGSFTYPCQFTLVAAMNPCPCGYLNSNNPKLVCSCPAHAIQRYNKKLSGPLLDRMDININIQPVDPEKLSNMEQAESSESIRKRVEQAACMQRSRLKKSNAEMQNDEIQRHCKLDAKSKELLTKAVDHFNLSARSYFRVLKVARTIADLSESEKVEYGHLAESLQYRRSTE